MKIARKELPGWSIEGVITSSGNSSLQVTVYMYIPLYIPLYKYALSLHETAGHIILPTKIQFSSDSLAAHSGSPHGDISICLVDIPVDLEHPVYQADQMVLSDLSVPNQSFRKEQAAVITDKRHFTVVQCCISVHMQGCK